MASKPKGMVEALYAITDKATIRPVFAESTIGRSSIKFRALDNWEVSPIFRIRVDDLGRH